MKTAIRMMLCLMMAASSAAAFAGGGLQRSAASGEDWASSTGAKPTHVQASDEAVGAASGEPSQVRDQKQDDNEVRKTKSIDEYNHRRFLEEVWTRP
jgi:hypothetical protein